MFLAILVGANIYLSRRFAWYFSVELIYIYNKGLHDYKRTKIFVGEGAGTFGPPIWVGSHSTITVFDLNPVTK